MRLANLAVLGMLIVLAVTATSVSILLLRRGRFYYWLEPESRPRRWVLILLLSLFAVFLAWFPIWIIWPNALVSRILTLVFAISFFVVGLTFKMVFWTRGFSGQTKGVASSMSALNKSMQLHYYQSLSIWAIPLLVIFHS